MNLIDRWGQTWADLALDVRDTRILSALLDCYREPHRAYHTLRHLDECFEQFDAIRGLCTHPGEVQLALWFHDAIYDTERSDNEDKSAAWADTVLLTAGAQVHQRERVGDLIVVTKHDVLPTSNDARLVVDIDLAILGAASERFDEYESQIRLEYSWMTETAFCQARIALINGFLERPAIFSTEQFRDRLERRARNNLKRSLGRLGAQ